MELDGSRALLFAWNHLCPHGRQVLLPQLLPKSGGRGPARKSRFARGGEIAWSALAQYEFYDSVSEDLQRMHELVRYLHRDPNGSLLRRIELGSHRVHEFFVARQAL